MKSKVRIPIGALGAILVCCPAAFSQIACPVASDITITGDLSFNDTSPCPINSGVTFTVPGPAPLGAKFTNNALMINNGTINTAGTLLNGTEAANATLLNFSVVQNSGTLVNGSGGFPSSDMLLNVSGAQLTNLGQLDNASNGTLGNSGNLTNAGSLNNNFGTINNNGGTINNLGTLTNNGGTLSNSGAIVNFQGATFTNQGLMTNNSGGSILNSGTFSTSSFGEGLVVNNGAIENSGTLFAQNLTNNSGATILNDSFSTLVAGGLTNSGSLTNNGTLNIDGALNIQAGGIVTNNGAITGDFSTLDIQAGGVLDNQAGSSFTRKAATTIVDGVLNSVPDLQSLGFLSGTGTINGNLDNAGGFVQPGDAPGTLTINGDYTQSPVGHLTIDLGGNGAGQFSVLDVSDLVALDGILDFTTVNGFTPGAGDDFTFLTFGALSGEFANVDFTNWTCPVGDTCTVVAGSNSLTLEIAGSTTSTPEPSMLPLLGVGILALGYYSKRKMAAARG